ncbi:MAG: hypothetical protein ACMG57_03870 [Candidatus Dojkabacteria bacterium]
MTQQRKVTLAILFVMTVLLAGVSIFITLRIQQNNAANDAAASGFGATATNNKFSSVFEEFAGYPCEAFLSQEKLDQTPNNTIIKKITSSVNNLAEIGALPYIPFNCTYKISDTQSIDILLHSYDTNSFIDNSAEELYARINTNLNTISDTEYFGTGFSYVTMFYGPGASPVSAVADASVCRSNLFHGQNDFEYLEIVYHGFSDCTTIAKDNLRITGMVSGTIITAMYTVNKKF